MMNHVKISIRLLVTFALILVILLCLAGFTAYKLNNVLSSVEKMKDETEILHLAETWQGNIKQNSARTVAIAYSSNGAEMTELFKKEMADVTAATTIIQDKYEKYAKERGDADDKLRLVTVGEARKEYLAVREKVKELKLAGDTEGAQVLLKEKMLPNVEKYIAASQANIDAQLDATATANFEVHEGVSSLLVWGSNLIVGCLILIGASGWFLYAGISRGIKNAQSLAESIGSGNLTNTIDAIGQDEFSQLERSMGKMQDSLSTVVHKVKVASESVSTASAEIAQGNNDLSARTEQQASALEETSASMMELSSKVRDNSQSADSANNLARTASSIAAKGSEEVSNVITTMNEINTSSNKIADIISVIDGIAFQTNILALNAAVEAARAGEEGRGFAVVASEVRSLAGRSAAAAKEIKQLINASVERVEQGTELVTKAGSTMTELSKSIEQVTALMGEISMSSSDQASGVSQVGEAIQQMDGVTQQNAALVEEMAAAAQSLQHQADDLVRTVMVFKV